MSEPRDEIAEVAEALAKANWGTESGPWRHDVDSWRDFASELLDWLAERDRRVAGAALRKFADSRGVNVGDEDDDYWRGYRQAQRECLHDAVSVADRIESGE